MVSLRKLYSVILTNFSKVTNLKILYLLNGKESAQKYIGVFCRFGHLSSNGIIAKIILRDLDLLFEGQILKCNYIWNSEICVKMHRTTLLDLDICYRTMTLRDLHLMTLTYFFMVKNMKFQYLGNSDRTSANMRTDFKYPALYHHFSFLKCKWSLSCSCRFVSTCIASTV